MMNILEQVNISYIAVAHEDNGKYKLVSDEALSIYQWICHSIICQAIAVFGTVTNIINIICFVKQGFKDPVNVSLFGLAISDLGSLITVIWFNICMTPAVQEADLPFDSADMIYLGSGWPHSIFSRVQSFLTAFITLERCLCISMPLKVSSLFTPRRVAVIVASFFILLILSVSPIYYVNRFAMVFSPTRNKTVLGIVLTENRMDVIQVSIVVNNLIIPFSAFAIIIVCTATLVIKLHRKSKWRQNVAAGNSESLMSRDMKLSRMIIIISTVFIVCFIPSCGNCVAMGIEPKIEMYGQYSNTFILLFGISFALETANSSVNIIIYYRMSSKFRATFRQLFNLDKNAQENRRCADSSQR